MRTPVGGLGLAYLLLTAGCGETQADEAGSADASATQADSSETETETGDDTGNEPPDNPFAELVDQGLADYIGTVTPSEVIEDGPQTHYRFDPADGPMCLRGGEYWISVREGQTAGKDVVIFLQGGGACWSELCTAFDTLGDPAIPASGMLNPTLAGNPFADWDVAFLPYCDGSLFAGDADIDDDDDGAIDRFHRGLINLSAGLDVARQRFPDAERIVLAGSSAGSYGVHLSNMLVRTLWPTAEIIVIADSGVGIGKPGEPEFVAGLLTEWNMAQLIPDSCPECVTDHITNLPDWQLDQDPNMRFAAISAYDDAIIGGVFLGLPNGEYRTTLEAELGKLAAAHPGRYHRYLFESALHTTIGADSMGGGLAGVSGTFDEPHVDGITVAAWLGLLVAGDPGFDDVIE